MTRPGTRLTVVMPTRDRALMMPRVLRSILAQRDVDLEVVVVDDGSTDGTGRVLAAIGDRRVRVVTNDAPRGVCAARNRGLAEVATEWVAFADDDDLWTTARAAALLDAVDRTPHAGWACGGVVIVDETGTPRSALHPPDPARVAADILRFNCVPGGGSAVVARTALVRRLGGFDTALHNLADWDMWIRLAQAAPLATADEPLLLYRRHNAGMSADLSGIRAEWEHVRANHDDARRVHGVDQDFVRFLRWTANRSLRAGLRRDAARTYTEIAWRSRDVGALAKAVAALALPDGVLRKKRRHSAYPLPAAWAAEACRCLEEADEPRPGHVEHRAIS